MQRKLDPNCEVVRYASGGHIDPDQNVVSGTAFKPRPVDEGMLSVNRLGIFSNDADDDLQRVREIAAEWMTIRKSGRFAQITATKIEETLKEASSAFALQEDMRTAESKPDDPSHALIHGIPIGEDDGAIAIRDMIAICVSSLHKPVVTS